MNTQVQQEIRDALKLNLNVERIPNVVPVIEVGTKIVKNPILKYKVRSTSGADTVYTTPTNQDVYLNYINFNFIKDATCDVADGELSVSIVQDGETKYFYLSVLTLTAQTGNLSIPFPKGIKLDRGSNISIGGNTFTVGKLRRSCNILITIDEQSLQ